MNPGKVMLAYPESSAETRAVRKRRRAGKGAYRSTSLLISTDDGLTVACFVGTGPETGRLSGRDIETLEIGALDQFGGYGARKSSTGGQGDSEQVQEMHVWADAREDERQAPADSPWR